MTTQRIIDSLNNKPENYILPFFWQHNEDDDTLIEEIHAIYNSGIKALCVESRDYQGFGTDCWWHTMSIILEECKKLDMKVWLLDDESFPSGKANGAFKKRPDLAACGITERHADVVGPITNGAVLTDWETSPEDELIAILACERQGHDEKLTGKVIDITANAHDGLVYFDLPDGCYRIIFLYKTRTGMGRWGYQYADMFCEESTDLFIEAVYEEHYKRYKEYFGNTFVGFFSDEPCFANATNLGYIADFGIKYCHFPWRDEFIDKLNPKFDGKFIQYLPALWYDFGDITAKVRFEFMDMLSKRYSENFCWKLGNWCRDHGVMYIGHVIEDMDQNTKTSGGAGHYFRALDGQDMGGIDSVLGQTTPGMTNYIMRVPCSYDISEPDFFHFTLPKLAPSHAHIQALKKGRSMCEIYGAYGWVEGLRMMKWMTDMMLVRGINYFVPHAFSPKFPDADCPPHMYAHGTNPEYKKFRLLMEYTNRMSHLFNGGLHIPCAAVHYHAEAEWADKKFTPCDKLARLLTENQLDYDIIPTDYLMKAVVENHKIVINGESYPCLIIPHSKYLSLDMLKTARRLADEGAYVIFEGGVPEKAADEPELDITSFVKADEHMLTLEMNEIVAYMYSKAMWDVMPEKKLPYLRYFHYSHAGNELYMLTNEGIHDEIKTSVKINGLGECDYGVYDVFENKMYKKHTADGTIEVVLPPYNSLVYVFGELPEGIEEYTEYTEKELIWLSDSYSVSTALEKDYPNFKHYKDINTLVNMAGKDELPRFSGHYRYEKTFTLESLTDSAKYILDLGYVGECATVFVNGIKCGDKIAPPYTFDITNAVRQGSNELAIEVTTHYGYELRDQRSRYIMYEPAGLLGKTAIRVLIKK